MKRESPCRAAIILHGDSCTIRLGVDSLNCESSSVVIFHSDRGRQYTSSEYIAAAERMGFKLSYSKKGCPFDNAPMESFHSVLKKEDVYLKHYSSSASLIFSSIDIF